jgi:septum formation protein
VTDSFAGSQVSLGAMFRHTVWMPALVLASGSPRRRDYFDQLGLIYTVRIPNVDESVRLGEQPEMYVDRVARRKAQAVDAAPAEVVVAADTTVALDSAILGKPVDNGAARRMLRSLSGRTHRVHTAVAVSVLGKITSEIVTTKVTFVELTDADIDWYLATGEHSDKAGAYGIQGIGGTFVESIDGSHSNVAGLPVAQTVAMLRKLGIDLLNPEAAKVSL